MAEAMHGMTTMPGRTALACAALLLAAGAVQAQELLTGTLAKARASGAITIGYRESSVPFSFLNTRKEPVGYSIELCRELVTAIGNAVDRTLAIRWEPVTSDSRFDAVTSGKVDLECGSTTSNLERQKRVSFSPTRKSAPSTSCSWISPATMSGVCAIITR